MRKTYQPTGKATFTQTGWQALPTPPTTQKLLQGAMHTCLLYALGLAIIIAFILLASIAI